jgi:hypothetical protein
MGITNPFELIIKIDRYIWHGIFYQHYEFKFYKAIYSPDTINGIVAGVYDKYGLKFLY